MKFAPNRPYRVIAVGASTGARIEVIEMLIGMDVVGADHGVRPPALGA
jgi:hypothetical protein